MAEHVSDAESKWRMLEVAAGYEKLAQRAEERLVSEAACVETPKFP